MMERAREYIKQRNVDLLETYDQCVATFNVDILMDSDGNLKLITSSSDPFVVFFRNFLVQHNLLDKLSAHFISDLLCINEQAVFTNYDRISGASLPRLPAGVNVIGSLVKSPTYGPQHHNAGPNGPRKTHK